MEDSRGDIPLWNWYNGQFLFQFDEYLRTKPETSIGEFFKVFLVNQNIDKLKFFHTKNQGVVSILLYGLLVVPKELWEKTDTNFKFKTRSHFDIKLIEERHKSTIEFLRLIRNSVAHVNYSVDSKAEKWTFWNNYKSNKNFEAEISHQHLGRFLEEVGIYYINEVRNKK